MSREGLSGFVTAAEHSLSLRKEIFEAANLKELISIAKKYGFNFDINDIKDDVLCEKTQSWFSKSKIPAIRKI